MWEWPLCHDPLRFSLGSSDLIPFITHPHVYLLTHFTDLHTLHTTLHCYTRSIDSLLHSLDWFDLLTHLTDWLYLPLPVSLISLLYLVLSLVSFHHTRLYLFTLVSSFTIVSTQYSVLSPFTLVLNSHLSLFTCHLSLSTAPRSSSPTLLMLMLCRAALNIATVNVTSHSCTSVQLVYYIDRFLF